MWKSISTSHMQIQTVQSHGTREEKGLYLLVWVPCGGHGITPLRCPAWGGRLVHAVVLGHLSPHLCPDHTSCGCTGQWGSGTGRPVPGKGKTRLSDVCLWHKDTLLTSSNLSENHSALHASSFSLPLSWDTCIKGWQISPIPFMFPPFFFPAVPQ